MTKATDIFTKEFSTRKEAKKAALRIRYDLTQIRFCYDSEKDKWYIAIKTPLPVS